jgi:ABC-type phosphate transport system substrate-binding protein
MSILCSSRSVMPIKTSMRTHLRFAALAIVLASNTARADVVAVASVKSPITALSKSEVVDIFLGKTTRFPNGTQAVPIDQGEGVSARDSFYAVFAGKSPAQVKAYWAKIIFTGRGQPPRSAPGDSQVRALLVANPQAIGYMERSAVDGTLKVLAHP